MKHVVSVAQFQDKTTLNKIFESAAKLKATNPNKHPASLQHKVVATLFYEPSTRTRLSFETAVQRLDGKIISTENAGQFSSAAKGETLEDSILTLNGYADAIVLRHPSLGSAQKAAEVSSIPIINAGDGAGEHPTQALLDMFTIQEAKGKIDGLTIGLVGDLLNGRTIHSLIQLLSLYNITLYCVAPEVLQLPQNYQDLLKSKNVKLVDTWEEVIGKVDVLYMTRIQKERFDSLEEYGAVKNSFVLDMNSVKKMKKDAVIMHPLPRVNEIACEVDDDPRAHYFEQAANGLYVRMALLAWIFEK